MDLYAPYSTVSFRMTLTSGVGDLAKYSMTWSVARSLLRQLNFLLCKCKLWLCLYIDSTLMSFIHADTTWVSVPEVFSML